MLAKKNTGTNTIMMMNSTTFSDGNARSWKMRTRISGVLGPQLDSDEPGEHAETDHDAAQVAGLLQPQTLACCRPSTLRPMPAAISTGPR